MENPDQHFEQLKEASEKLLKTEKQLQMADSEAKRLLFLQEKSMKEASDKLL